MGVDLFTIFARSYTLNIRIGRVLHMKYMGGKSHSAFGPGKWRKPSLGAHKPMGRVSLARDVFLFLIHVYIYHICKVHMYAYMHIHIYIIYVL